MNRTSAVGEPGDLGPVGRISAEGGDHPRIGNLVDRPGVKLRDHPAANDAEAMLFHCLSTRRYGLQRFVRSDQTDAGDLPLADVHDQAVTHVYQQFGIGDWLPRESKLMESPPARSRAERSMCSTRAPAP